MRRGIFASIALGLCLFTGIVSAKESGGEAGASLYTKLNTFTVNLKGLGHLLQVDISLKSGDPTTTEQIKAFTPVIRNELIFILSSHAIDEVNTLSGKLKLMEDIKVSLNKVLNLDPKHGISSVLFESFVIQ